MKLTVKTEYPATMAQQQMLAEREEREAAELERLYRVWLEEQDEDILYVPTKKRQNP